MDSWVDKEAMSRVLVCEVGRERYALPFQDVVEVVQAVAITPLPGAPAIVEGIVNYRGRVVPCIELRARFANIRRVVLPSDLMVFAQCGPAGAARGAAGRENIVALRIPGKLTVLSIDDRQMTRAQALRGAARGIAGVVPREDGLLLICDLAAFLDATERDGLEEALGRLSLA